MHRQEHLNKSVDRLESAVKYDGWGYNKNVTELRNVCG